MKTSTTHVETPHFLKFIPEQIQAFEPNHRMVQQKVTRVRRELVSKQRERGSRFSKRVFATCLQICETIPGAKLKFSKNNNPYFIIRVQNPTGETITASVMPLIVRSEDKNGKLNICLRWPFGVGSEPNVLDFESVTELVNYLQLNTTK